MKIYHVVLVPFYRGAVVFDRQTCIWVYKNTFSSPFIEERLYFKTYNLCDTWSSIVLVPFYRGAVVFPDVVQDIDTKQALFSSPFIEERLYLLKLSSLTKLQNCSRPLLSRSGCICCWEYILCNYRRSSRPLLSRSGCIYKSTCVRCRSQKVFSSPFIEERLYFKGYGNITQEQRGFSSPFIEERLYLEEN